MQDLIIIRWMLFFFCVSLTAILIHQSWMNLIRRKFSKFSIDALMMLMIRMISNDWGNKVIVQFENNPHSIRILGIYAFAGSVTLLFGSVKILLSLLITH